MIETPVQKPRKTPVVYVRPQTNVYAIKFHEGGELPRELLGSFTTQTLANRAIQVWSSKKYDTKKVKSRA